MGHSESFSIKLYLVYENTDKAAAQIDLHECVFGIDQDIGDVSQEKFQLMRTQKFRMLFSSIINRTKTNF